jgi:hypothetical protein
VYVEEKRSRQVVAGKLPKMDLVKPEAHREHPSVSNVFHRDPYFVTPTDQNLYRDKDVRKINRTLTAMVHSENFARHHLLLFTTV